MVSGMPAAKQAAAKGVVSAVVDSGYDQSLAKVEKIINDGGYDISYILAAYSAAQGQQNTLEDYTLGGLVISLMTVKINLKRGDVFIPPKKKDQLPSQWKLIIMKLRCEILFGVPAKNSIFQPIHVEDTIGKAFAYKLLRQVLIVLIKEGKFLGVYQLQRVDGLLDFLPDDAVEVLFRYLHGELHIVWPGRVKVFQTQSVTAFDLQETLHRQERIGSHPGEQTPHIAAKVN